MLAENVETLPVSEPAHKAAFFRQSGWLMIATIVGGGLMYLVHPLGKFAEEGEYGLFVTLLSVVMLLPNIPLQMVLAQQTAKALANQAEHELSGIIRMFLGLTVAVWLVGSVVVLAFQGAILEHWKMTSPVGLWVTLAVVLVSVWGPVFAGVLQGQQNFLWLGWTQLITAMGRVSFAAIAVLVFHSGAVGMMVGVFLGAGLAVAVSGWQTRALWLPKPQPFDWRSLLAQVSPLLLAFLGFQVLFTADSLFVKAYFTPQQMDCYGAAGTLSRALMWLVLPLATVMFPRLVHSAAKSEKTNLFGLVLAVTAGLALLGDLGVSLVGPWVVKLVAKSGNAPLASAILPWYATAMVPIALANVLLNDLLARPASKFGLALCVFAVGVGYLVAVTQFHAHLVNVLQTMGIAGLVLLAVSALFSRRSRT